MIAKAFYLLADAPAGRVFGLDKQTLIGILIQLLNVCILAVVLGLILYKPVRKFMKNRADGISARIAGAKGAEEKAEAIKAEYQIKLKEIDTKREEVISAARIDAEKAGKEIIDKAQEEAENIRRRAKDSVADEKKRLKKQTKQHIIEVASLMAEKFVKNSMDTAAQDKLFDDALAELEKSVWTD